MGDVNMGYDEILEYLVQKTEETGVGIGLTLFVKGFVIQGALVQSRHYYDFMSKLLEESETRKTKTIIYTDDKVELGLWKSYSEEYKKFMMQLRAKGINGQEGRLEYIHLSKVLIYQPSSTEHIVLPYWRGKLSSVDGFCVGDVRNQET